MLDIVTVVARPTVHRVGGIGVIVQRVIARPAIKRIQPRVAAQNVAVGIALNTVITGVTDQTVIARIAQNGVIAAITKERVRPRCPAPDRINHRAAQQCRLGIGQGLVGKDKELNIVGHKIHTLGRGQHKVGRPRHRVDGGRGHRQDDPVRSGAAINRVIAAKTRQTVITVPARQPVAPGIAAQVIGNQVAGQRQIRRPRRIGQMHMFDKLRRAEGKGHRGQNRVIALAVNLEYLVAQTVDDVGVIARKTAQAVFAAAAVQTVVAIVAAQFVGAGRSRQIQRCDAGLIGHPQKLYLGSLFQFKADRGAHRVDTATHRINNPCRRMLDIVTVVARPTVHQHANRAAAAQRIQTVAAIHRHCRAGDRKAVIAVAAIQRVLTTLTIQRVISGPARKAVIARAAQEAVIARAAIQRVMAVITEHPVITAPPGQDVDAVVATDFVGRVIGGQIQRCGCGLVGG